MKVMFNTTLPFNPLRESLYAPAELYGEFSTTDPSSYTACVDLKILTYFAQSGGYFTRFGKKPSDRGGATLEALHDNSISLAIQSLLASRRDVVAIMGGHKLNRADESYREVARMAREIAGRGLLVASGGGPGAMEAAHLGALFSQHPPADLESAMKSLESCPELPESTGLVREDCTINTHIAAALHEWLIPAFEILGDLPAGNRGASLAVPTWLYGYEPTTPFATYIAKYFQNSLREDGLVTLASRGIVYAEGSAGTVQEIFQDAAQNFYYDFCPMVFLSAPGRQYWEKNLPVRPLITALLGERDRGSRKLLFTDSRAEVVDFLLRAK